MGDHKWLCCCDKSNQDKMTEALMRFDDQASINFFDDATLMRKNLLYSPKCTRHIALGFSERGVSELNLAAALVRDGTAEKVALIGDHISGSTRSRAARAGIDEVIDTNTLPVCTLKDKNQTKRASKKDHGTLRRVQTGERRHRSPILVISSGRGGVGKTSIALLLALIASSWEMKVGIVDLDLANGNLFSGCGLTHGAYLDQLLSALKEFNTKQSVSQLSSSVLDAAKLSISDNVKLWGPCERPEMSECCFSFVEQLLSYVSEICDLVIVDTSATCTEASAQAFQSCDRLLLVHDEGQKAIASLSRVASLAVRLGTARTRIIRVANRADRRSHFDLSIARNEKGLETARAYRVFEGGAEVRELISSGHAQELLSLKTPFMQSLSFMLASILQELGRLPHHKAAAAALSDEIKPHKLWGFQKKQAI